jgi:hypothetical protein
MKMIMLTLKHRPENYDVTVEVYDENGKLVEKKEHEGIKQIVVRGGEVRISRQIAGSPTVIVINAEKPELKVKAGSIIYVEEGKA